MIFFARNFPRLVPVVCFPAWHGQHDWLTKFFAFVLIGQVRVAIVLAVIRKLSKGLFLKSPDNRSGLKTCYFCGVCNKNIVVFES